MLVHIRIRHDNAKLPVNLDMPVYFIVSLQLKEKFSEIRKIYF